MTSNGNHHHFWRRLWTAVRGPAAELAYGVTAGNAIRHGHPAPPPPRISRDAAVAAYFEGREARWRVVYDDAIRTADGPGQRLLAVFDAVQAAAVEPPLRNITLADTELAQGPLARAVVDRHHGLLRRRLEELAVATGADDPQDLARSVELLSRGAAGVTGSDAVRAIAVARDAARERLEDATYDDRCRGLGA